MPMKEPTPTIRIESRWLAGIAVTAVVVMLAVLPGRLSVYPAWAPYALWVVMIVPMAGAGLTVGMFGSSVCPLVRLRFPLRHPPVSPRSSDLDFAIVLAESSPTSLAT